MRTAVVADDRADVREYRSTNAAGLAVATAEVPMLGTAPSGELIETVLPTAAAQPSRPQEAAAGSRRRRPWPDRYQSLLLACDLTAALAGLAVAAATRFATPAHDLLTNLNWTFALAMPLVWIVAVAANGGYERRFVGVGNAEFDRIFHAWAHLTIASVLVLYLVSADVARGFAFPALGLALGLDLVLRFAARKHLHRRRRRGAAMTQVVVVGALPTLVPFAQMLRRDRHAGMRVVGACVPDAMDRDPVAEARLAEQGVPILGDVDTIVDAVEAGGAHAVVVLSGQVKADKLRWISWQLEGSPCSLVVSPGLADFAGGRLHIQPVAGLPLLHVDKPKFAGPSRIVKELFDRSVAAGALVLLAPALLLIGLMVRVTSRGPALFCQTRVGRNGREFRMVKFRSMVADAEDRLPELVAANEHDGVLFKIRRDPRITRVGRVLRRFSLDELPQLLNVLTGSMSLVGPRPPLPVEVAAYADDVRRRLLVKPGLTGLWQVSGRSDLSWEESVRLDLRYVEDWSLSLDMIVLWKTLRVVIKAHGAY